MITSIFEKSKPINFVFCAGILLIYLVVTLFLGYDQVYFKLIPQQIISYLVLVFSLFVIDFVVKKNEITSQNNYAIFLFVLLIGFLPDLFNHPKAIFLNFLLLLAFRRLISIRSLRAVKQKLFDASMYIAIASIIEPWSIIYFIIVYITIIMFVSKDYRNWLVPIVAYLGILFITITYLWFTNTLYIEDYKLIYKFDLSYYTDSLIIIHSGLLLLSLIGGVAFAIRYKKFSSKRKIVSTLVLLILIIGVVFNVFTINQFLFSEIVLLFPLAILLVNFLKNIQKEAIKNVFILLLIALGVLIRLL